MAEMARDEARVGVLLSGRGSNFVALYEAMERGEIPARIAVVIGNRADAPGLKKAAERGIRALHLPYRRASLEADEEAMLSALREAGVEWVCLAGFMRLLSSTFIRRYRMRILNIHPSLLPAFPGLEAQRQAVEHGVRFSGCTVHFVDEGLDSGPIVHQAVVPVLQDDSPDDLARRILAVEHSSYTTALRRLLTRRWEIEGRRVCFEPEALSGHGPAALE